MASLMDEVAGLRERLVVMTSTSKTYNVASTDCAVAAIPDEVSCLTKAIHSPSV